MEQQQKKTIRTLILYNSVPCRPLAESLRVNKTEEIFWRFMMIIPPFVLSHSGGGNDFMIILPTSGNTLLTIANLMDRK